MVGVDVRDFVVVEAERQSMDDLGQGVVGATMVVDEGMDVDMVV